MPPLAEPTAPAAAGARSIAGDDAALGALIEAIIDQAPGLVRGRLLLPSVDWRHATGAQISRLSERLAGARLGLPAWLARDIALAGHALPAPVPAVLPAETRLLAELNRLDAGAPISEAMRRNVLDVVAPAAGDPAVVRALSARLAALGETALAARLALAAWPRVMQGARTLGKHVDAHLASLPRLGVRIAGFSTTQVLADAFLPAFAAHGRRVEVALADYGAVIAELLQPARTGDPLFLLLDLATLVASDWRSGADESAARSDERLALLADAIAAYAQRDGAMLYANSLPAVTLPALGHLDRAHRAGSAAVAARVNQTLADLAARFANVHLVDADVALGDVAPARRSDAKLWYFGRIAYSEEATRHLARAFAQAWAARTRRPVKVVALDFDNTLWGGVYGDDGVGALACGDTFPGNAFKAFQQEVLRLKAQGLLLVALSKNNPDAITAFADHPGMALAADDFAATAIDWQPKPDNIKRIARELNLGLDSFLFLDDSAHEREAMRRMCPEVVVPELPADPAERPGWLRSLASTWPVRLTHEDTQRSAMYLAERKARELRQSCASYDDYLAGLDQRLTVARTGPEAVARVAQLHERTNQFNLTTRRFSEPELTERIDDARHWLVLHGGVEDRFGAHGIVIAAVVRIEGEEANIESLLMSCRVMARRIESAFLAALLGALQAHGVTTVVGHYAPTAKNAMVREFYAANGFEPGDGEGRTWYWRRGASAVPQTPAVTVIGSDRWKA